MDTVPSDLRVQAEAYAFRALMAHLQAHPDLQNMDAMSSTVTLARVQLMTRFRPTCSQN
jgi:hypothetical protein